VLLRAQGEGVHVDTLIGVAGVGLVRLDPRKVRTFSLRESVLSVKLEFSSDNRVLSPAVHIEGSLGENESTSIRHRRTSVVVGISVVEGRVVVRVSFNTPSSNIGSTKVRLVVGVGRSVPVSSEVRRNPRIKSTSILEETTGIDKGIGVESNFVGSSEGVDSVGEGINGIGVVERLSTKGLEESRVADKRGTVIYVLIGLNNPDEFLNRVVEVKSDLVGRRTNRLITSELELSNQVLMGVLGHSAAFVSVKEHIIDIERSSNKRLVVSNGSSNRSASRELLTGGRVSTVERGNSPQALINRSDVKVNLDLVVLESNKGKGKSGVCAEPELERNVESSLRKSISGGAHLSGGKGVARSIDLSERRIGDECKLGGVTNHLEVTSLLFRSHSKLVPDVHPVTILSVNSLASNLDLNLGNKLFSREVQPTGIDSSARTLGVSTDTHKLVNLGESNLKIGSVSKITISADGAGNVSSEIGLTIEGLLDGFNSKVSVSAISHLPEGNLRVTSKVDILCSVSYKLH
jgi:hypothetical protein